MLLNVDKEELDNIRLKLKIFKESELFSYQELTDFIGVNRSTLWEFLHEERTLTYKNLRKIKRFLKDKNEKENN